MCHREALSIWLWSTCLPPIHPPASNHPIVCTEAMPWGFTLTCITSCMSSWAQFCRRGGQNNRNTSLWFPKNKSWSTHSSLTYPINERLKSFMLNTRKYVTVRKEAVKIYYMTDLFLSQSLHLSLSFLWTLPLFSHCLSCAFIPHLPSFHPCLSYPPPQFSHYLSLSIFHSFHSPFFLTLHPTVNLAQAQLWDTRCCQAERQLLWPGGPRPLQDEAVRSCH